MSKHFTNYILLDSKYKLFKNINIGSGSFGQVFIGQNNQNKQYKAIKVEKINDTLNSQLKHEYSILKYLEGCEGIPKCYSFINIKDYNFLIMDLYGSNLSNLLKENNNHFSIKTIINLGIQMLERIEEIHKRHIIHRDIKPKNFVIGNTDYTKNYIYLIDFGLSKRFRNPKTGEHILYKDDKKFIGTLKYSSIYTHLGIEQSRRDDLEGMMYTLIYLFKGFLPWDNIKAKNNEMKNYKILEQKININVDKLCEGMPIIFPKLLLYIRSLQFEEKPDYEFIKKSFISEYNCQFSILYNNFELIEKKEDFINDKKENEKLLNNNVLK